MLKVKFIWGVPSYIEDDYGTGCLGLVHWDNPEGG